MTTQAKKIKTKTKPSWGDVKEKLAGDQRMMTHADQIDYAAQRSLVAALQDARRFPHAANGIRLIETHISWVLIAGDYAYKIKKALDLGFLDFTTLKARQFYCSEELRLNHRLAPEVYLDVTPIGGTSDEPQLGAQPAIEYAVRMRSFAPENQLDHLLERGDVLSQEMDGLAATLAEFHSNLPSTETDSIYGTPASIQAVVQQNLEQLKTLVAEEIDSAFIADIIRATQIAYEEQREVFRLRHQQGFVRECHGDLHLGNIALIGKRLVPFDGLEFNPALRWIDVMDEAAFLVMDFLHVQQAGIAFRFLNAYLEVTGDYSGVSVLRFYVAYRAEVRAKICALRAPQLGEICKQQMADCRGYLALAAENLAPCHPALIITHGLPGSGKSTFSQAALERYQAIRIRSDVERKRLLGLKPLADSHAIKGSGIYSAEISGRTYEHLHDRTREILASGYSVIVDAAFLQENYRDRFRKLALSMSIPFVIVSMRATAATLKSRIMLRRNHENDASEADIAVLEKLQASRYLLLPHELAKTVEFVNESDGCGISADNPSWAELDKLLAG